MKRITDVRDAAGAAFPSPAARWRLAALMALLALAAAALYLPALGHRFLYDDSFYVTENARVRAGLSLAGVRWAFTNLSAGYWQPLAWLSHMADVQLFGLDPGGHHAQGLALHALNASLLLFALSRLTGALWRPALVAALFALHPLHVESVAWVSTRKDVLSALFWMLALVAHARRVRAPGLRADAAVALLALLALMGKPSAAALPLALLILDGWPLARLGRVPGPAPTRRALLEKVPLLLITAAVALPALAAGLSEGVVPSQSNLVPRLQNAAVAAVAHLLQAFWPFGLAAFYPRTLQLPWWTWSLSLLFLAAVTAVAVRQRRRRPWLAAGWAWYLAALASSSGILQVSACARADRYTYLPLIGIYVIAAWGGAEALGRARRCRRAGALATLAVLAVLAGATRVQVMYWRDSMTLFTHALAVTKGNWLANYAVAGAHVDRGDLASGEEYYRRAIGIHPTYTEALNNLGILLSMRGDLQSALGLFLRAAAVAPHASRPQLNLGRVQEKLGNRAAAREAFRRALNLDPELEEARAGLRRLEASPPAPRQ